MPEQYRELAPHSINFSEEPAKAVPYLKKLRALTQDTLPTSIRGRTLIAFLHEKEFSRELAALQQLFNSATDPSRKKYYLDKQNRVRQGYDRLEKKTAKLRKHLRYHFYTKRFEFYYQKLREIYSEVYEPEQSEYEAYNALTMYGYHVVQNGERARDQAKKRKRGDLIDE